MKPERGIGRGELFAPSPGRNRHRRSHQRVSCPAPETSSSSSSGRGDASALPASHHFRRCRWQLALSLSPLRKWLSNGRVAVSSSPSPPSPFSYSFFSLGTPRSGATTSLSSEAFFPPPYPPLLVLQLLPFPPPLHGSRLGRGRRRKTE